MNQTTSHYILAPASPTNVTLDPKSSFGFTRLSWDYTSSCPITRFHITVETKSKPLLLTASKKEIFLPSLPKCAKFTTVVFASNLYGNGLQSKPLEVFSPDAHFIAASFCFRLIAVPVPPSSVRVTTVANSSTVSVTWRDNPDCDIDGYLVRIYAKDWSLVKMLETTNQQANILDVPTCVPLVVGVQGHNRAGNGSESRSAEFIIQSVPAIPKAVRVTSTSEPQAVDVTWQYESLCNAHIFRIDLHTTSGLSFKPLESRGRRRRITDLPTCVNMYASVRGRNEFGFGMQKESSEFVIQAVPGPTSNIQVDTVGNAPQVTAKWSYEDACDVVEFSVNVYDSSKNSLKSLQTPNKSVDIPDLPQCVNLTVGVQGRNALGLGLETKGSEFSILAVPGPTSNIQVDTVGNAPQVTAKWSYEDACDVVEFSVNVYDSSKNSLKSLQTPNKSVDIPDLPQCVNLTVGVQGRNALGLGLETKGSEFSILAVPGPTSNIQVDTVGNAPQVTAKWSYEDACDVVEFSVNVYDSSKNSLKSLQTPNKSVDIPDLPQCVNLTVGVQGRNALGLGLETKGSEFSILAAPGLIQNIQVDTLESASQVTAYWSYEAACDVVDFSVNVYDVKENSLKSMRTATRSIEIFEIPQCVDLRVGVQGRNAQGLGPETKSSIFFIPAAPKAPDWIDVTLESGVTVLWEQESACLADRFVVAVYNSTATISNITVDGNEYEVRLPDLPQNMSLFIGIRGYNSFGAGPEINSTVFTIPKDPAASIHRHVSLLRNTSQETTVMTTMVPETSTSRQRSMHEDHSIAQSQEPGLLNDIPEGVSSCDSGTTDGCIQSEYQSDQQVVNQVDRTFSDGPVEPPSSVTLELSSCKALVTVTWTHKTAKEFTVTFYSGVHATKEERTQSNSMTFTNLPQDLPLRVGVVAHEDNRMSAEATSAELYLPSCEKLLIFASFRNAFMQLLPRSPRAINI
ncbi:hypothetical protein CSKR_104938 [Clonorchis sinensis]|uniref:Fibronectin type-III domain-containing protein n=1 Tax=Clonorchis sinensis TaxID=79923 RepID=A0A8T1N0Z5_CLOSI|nr:hypothetical protein CSKR_104938 [Clonorchis sinensis]